MNWLLNLFGNIKNIFLALGGLTIGIWAVKQKYNAYQAESKLKNIENKIAKTNVVIAKTKAKAKAQAVKAETDTHVETLKELKKEAKKVQKEMEVIEKDIEVHKKSFEIKKVSGRVRHGKISVDI
jgi:predicted  nucleic acid-binding Zn-ribbon protein